MSEIRNRLFRTVNSDRAADFRELSDNEGRDCVPASLFEVSAVLSDKALPRVPELQQIADELNRQTSGHTTITAAKNVISAIDSASKKMDIAIERIYLKSDMEDEFNVPSRIKITKPRNSVTLKGEACIRLLSADKPDEEGHAESDGTLRGNERVRLQKQAGMIDAALIKFRKRRTGLLRKIFGQ